MTIERAFEIALEVESSEIEDVVLDLLQALKGEAERERAVKLLIHDLGDLSYMIEKHTTNHALLERADRLLEHQVGRLRAKAAPPVRRLRRVRAEQPPSAKGSGNTKAGKSRLVEARNSTQCRFPFVQSRCRAVRRFSSRSSCHAAPHPIRDS